MKTLIITLAKNEFVECDGKLYHKVISREWVLGKGAEFGTTWGERANELLNQGQTFFEVATTLNAEGYRSKHGKLITESTIRCRKWYLKKITRPTKKENKNHDNKKMRLRRSSNDKACAK